MKYLAAFTAAAMLWPTTPSWPAPDDRPALTVCMQQNNPPLSTRAGDKPGGFDLALTEAIADRLNRTPVVQWFVSRDDPDASLPRDANALLSDGRCQLVADYPLTAHTLDQPHAPVAKLPPFDGAKPDDRTRWVRIGTLAATRPYRLDTLAVVLGQHAAGHRVLKLGDLDGLRIGVPIATLADAIAMQYDGGRLNQHVVHLPDPRDVFEALQKGTVDAALVDLRAFDAWRLRHGSSTLVLSDYRHSVGFNMGFVGLASDTALLKQVDAALATLQADGAIASLAEKSGLTFVPPRSPAVAPDLRPAALNGD